MFVCRQLLVDDFLCEFCFRLFLGRSKKLNPCLSPELNRIPLESEMISGILMLGSALDDVVDFRCFGQYLIFFFRTICFVRDVNSRRLVGQTAI
jgi:hypothetical protein